MKSVDCDTGLGRRRHRGVLRMAGVSSLLACVGFLSAGVIAPTAHAAETRGYVVSWFYMAAASQEDDCPDGFNQPSEEMARKILVGMGKSPQEIDALFKDFPNNLYRAIVMRGKIDGKPANVYPNPTSEPDPQIKTAQGHVAYGFNLDGKDGPDDFVDPETNEHGVDNMAYRALGCFIAQRGAIGTRPTYPVIQWDGTRDQMPAWLIEISGVQAGKDGTVQDGDVKVGIYRATSPIARNASGEPQADMTFQVDPNPRMQNSVHGTIRDGVVTTDPFELYMVQDPFGVTEYHFKQAKLRLALNADGSLKGILGGYEPWLPLYTSFALGGSVNELNLSIDVPGIYYALKRLADAYPDASGQNTYISSGYWVEAVPAFVAHPDATKTSALDQPLQTAQK
jgi:hypothetical protein